MPETLTHEELIAQGFVYTNWDHSYLRRDLCVRVVCPVGCCWQWVPKDAVERNPNNYDVVVPGTQFCENEIMGEGAWTWTQEMEEEDPRG